MKIIPIFILIYLSAVAIVIYACTPQSLKSAQDFFEGESQVIGKINDDLDRQQPAK
jgi:hypothetical protein